jgi:ABC-2 type transport system permease protein
VNIFLREVKANVRSLLIWGAIVLFFSFVGFSKFAGYEGNDDLVRILQGMPPALMEAFQMNAFNLTTVTGFYGVMFTYFALLLSIAAAMWGSDIISKEERDRTVEFSLVLPVTRSRVVTAKALAALVNCIGLLLITWAATAANATQYQTDGEFWSLVSLSMVGLLIMQLIFLAVGLLLGCALKHYKRASSAAVSVLLATYFLSIISGLNENLEFLKWFSPFKYFDAGLMLRESRLEPAYIGVSAGIIAVALVAAYLTYARRDLYI